MLKITMLTKISISESLYLSYNCISLFELFKILIALLFLNAFSNTVNNVIITAITPNKVTNILINKETVSD